MYNTDKNIVSKIFNSGEKINIDLGEDKIFYLSYVHIDMHKFIDVSFSETKNKLYKNKMLYK